MPFDYYKHLSPELKAVYRKSDSIGSVDVPNLVELSKLATQIDEALESEKRERVSNASNAFAAACFTALGVPNVRVHVRSTRPSSDHGELLGLYTFADDEDPARIEVWMRTAAHRQVVRFRTYLRTLVHEMLHHLDATLYALPESFHTEGFYRRESALMRALVPELAEAAKKKKKKDRAAKAAKAAEAVATPTIPKKAPTAEERKSQSRQLDLFS